YGTALGAAELGAKASVPGIFVYTPAAGEVLSGGVQTLTATFTPADGAGYSTAQAAVPLTINKATSTIAWAKPAAVVYGTALGAAQLNATASVPGAFAYTPAASAVLTAGAQTLSVAFTPADSANYATAKATVSLTVTKAKPAITWPTPTRSSPAPRLAPLN